MEQLDKNHGGYCGETINIRTVLRDIETAAQQHGWSSEILHQTPDFKFLALHRSPVSSPTPRPAPRIYISTGIHGDEPAGPLAALRLLLENRWPTGFDLWFCPCLNPMGFVLNRRENADGKDLNRDYRHLETAEMRAHIAWLERQPQFDLHILLHEDWESHGFYLYELNPDNRPSLAEPIITRVAESFPIDRSETIEGRPAQNGVIRPNFDPAMRPQWAEAFYLIVHKSRLGYTLESPSDFPLADRVDALVTGINVALQSFSDWQLRK